MKKFYTIILFSALALGLNLLFLNPAQAKNDCKRDGCKITITINIVFVGATQAQIDNWTKEIESTWDSPTTGKCACDVSFKVAAKTAASCTAASAQGSHCIEVTVENPRDNNNKVYTAFMWGISKNGSSITGKWGPNTSGTIPGSVTFGLETYTPTPGETYVDAAHEAGHMLGLPDEYDAASGSYPNNLMGRTWGSTAKPNQGHIDSAVANNCKGDDSKCPNECCCGRNGKVDTDPKEECDPSATPTGCKEMQSCDKNCKCINMKATPICGDGYITKPEEECDPKAKPIGCALDEECIGCKCQKVPMINPPTNEPPLPPTTNTNTNQPPSQPTGTPTDTDNDGVADTTDNCINVSNPDQADIDNDGHGDVCDSCTDKDTDGYSLEGGSCSLLDCDDNNNNVNPGKPEDCADGLDNNCDGQIDAADSSCQIADTDGDGITDAQDNCPIASNPDQADWDQDGKGDACDFCIDIDHDGYDFPGGGSCSAAEDCNDHDSAIYPGKIEACDGIDNNCDGIIDETCLPGITCGDGLWDAAFELCDQSAIESGCPYPLICSNCNICLSN